MKSRNSRRPQRKSAHPGKILQKLKTRSGYVTVRSLANSFENTNGCKCPSVSTLTAQKNVVKKNSKSDVISPSKRTRVSTASNNTHGALLNATVAYTSFKVSLKKRWIKDKSFSSAVGEFLTYPFKVVTIHQLLDSNDYLQTLAEEVLSLPFDFLCNDLHEFEQSQDLFESPVDSPALNAFLGLLKGPLHNWMQDVTGKKLSDKVTATGSKYAYSNYLLCHDDNLSDRSIAFILYLSEDWSENDGGALQLFNCNERDEPEKVVHSIVPAFGSFVFFEVTSQSYHQVQEIFSKSKVRLSINGWFHGDELPVKPQVEIEGPKFLRPVSPKGCSFEKWLNPRYLVSEIHAEIKSDFGYDLSVNLPEFFLDSVYLDLELALRKDSVVWERCGPAHQRNYEKAKLSSLPQNVQEFLKLLKSKYMFYFLSEVTVDINPDSKTTPLWHLEVQRWSPGDYTLVVDNDQSSEVTGIDIHLYFNVPEEIKRPFHCGTVRYLGPEKDSSGFLEQNAEVEPEKNALFLVAHIAGMKRVTKYIDHRENLCFHKIVATYSQG